MCGIFGAWLKRPLTEADTNQFKKVTKKLSHRGPDGNGTYINASRGQFLGHQRLSIIDLSSNGDQPMKIGEDVIIFNGEIYNFLEIREDLKRQNIEFVTSSDTEVLLKAFQKWGVNAFEKFDGMFSIAIISNGNLFLATDPFGEKPLYYVSNNDGVFFASEPLPLIELLDLSFKPTQEQQAEFLSLGFISKEETGFPGLKFAQPASIIKFKTPFESSVEKYWQQKNPDTGKGVLKESDLDNIHELLMISLKRRLRSDVPLGLFLSAGVDSSLLASIIVKDLNYELRTFTFGFPDGNDETGAASEIAKLLGTDHLNIHQVHDPYNGDYPSAIQDLYQVPNDNLTALSVYQMSKAAREHIKVAIMGTGGDELAIGYNKYSFLSKWRLAYNLTPTQAHTLSRLLSCMGLHKKSEILKNFLAGNYARRISALKNGMASRVLDDIYEWLNISDPLPNSKFWLNKMRMFDMTVTLPLSYNQSIDRGSMRASLEVRCPYLNKELFETVSRFESQLLMAKGPKFILRKLLMRYLPLDYVNRPKSGFILPITRWSDNLRDPLISRVLNKSFMPVKGNYNEGIIAFRIAILNKMGCK